MSRDESPSNGRLRRVGIVDRAKVDASAAGGSVAGAIVVAVIAEGVIAAEMGFRIAARIVMQGGLAATIGRMLCGRGLHRVERVRRRVAMT